MWMLTARVLSNGEGRVRGYAQVRTRVRVPVDLMSLLVMLSFELTYSFVSDRGGGRRGPLWFGSIYRVRPMVAPGDSPHVIDIGSGHVGNTLL